MRAGGPPSIGDGERHDASASHERDFRASGSSPGDRHEVSGHGFSRADSRFRLNSALEAPEKLEDFSEMHEKHASGAEAPIGSCGFVPGMNPRPTARMSFSAACLAAEGTQIFRKSFPHGLKPRKFVSRFAARLKSFPDTEPFLRIAGRIALIVFSVALQLGVAAFAFAQQQPTAHELAQRVDRHYNQLHSLKAGFTESYAGMGMQRSESGTLLLEKPGRMRWDYSNPPGKVFLLDGKYAWFYAPGEPQIQRMQAKELDDLRSPLRFLLGHTELEKEMDSLTLKPAPEGRFTLSGRPKGQEQRVSRLSITVTADGTITGIEIDETDEAITRFTFSGETPNAPVPADVFRFKAPAGTTVVDAAPPA
jgi:outer membrane lipoprotein carrier protein